ncbi:hypothetical protein [Actinocatenispora rupis]|uniref:Uncharacterized protein n=1 Tax=Actinocatenispora rupis TaxID=519421 RepID=A0A8J3NEW1_9ACTN|nr:hypothetical protein [Actinocatenispora rupis]GID13049.1 hypothetical protein Aru02nite_39380 [Actinocatenispora rupis]
MRGTQIGALTDDAVPGLAEALAVVDGLDDALANGLGRLGEPERAALAALAAAAGASPLATAAADAVATLAAGTVADEYLAAVAGARAALLGAVHDALLAAADTGTGRSRAEWDATGGDSPGVPLAAARSWLTELAVTGWRGVGEDLVAASAPVVATLLAEPRTRRLAVLLDGFAAELRACTPIATMEHLPYRRWGDLWSRAVLLAQDTWPGPPAAAPVSGRLLPLGVDVHEHATAVQFEVHGVLETAGGARLVRVAAAAAKVDTIVGPAVWTLVDRPVLLGALAAGRALELTDMPLLPGGDLLWREDAATPGEPADPFTTARLVLPEATAAGVPPLDRHPVRIAEPVLLEDYTVTDHAAVLDGRALPFDTDRLPGCGPLTPELVAASTACIGLLRWDAGGWRVQPLAVRTTVKRKPATVATADWAQGPTDPKVAKAEARNDAVAVLRERAGRLLRS